MAGKGDTVEQRAVTLGAEAGDLVVVEGQIAEGDRVITGNVQKIGPGMPVKPIEGDGAPKS